MRYGKPSTTAMVVAYWRTLGDMGVTTIPGFRDPCARHLLTGFVWKRALRWAEARARRPNGFGKLVSHLDGLLLRVVFIDALLAASSAPQVVVLGAGLDTRAWRLDALRGRRVFEVDHPSTQHYKRARVGLLAPALAEVTFVPVDFTKDDLARALDAAGHDPNRPTFWLWEGVIMYLDDAALRGTLAVARKRSAPGSVLAAHYHEPDLTPAANAFRKLLLAWMGEPQIGLRTRAVMQEEIRRAGFGVVEDAGIPEQAARVGAHAPEEMRLRVSRVLVANV